jgi:hypothetical protein
VGSK